MFSLYVTKQSIKIQELAFLKPPPFQCVNLEKNPPNIPDADDCILLGAMPFWFSPIYPTNSTFSFFLGRRKVVIGLMITVPMDTTSDLVAVLNASGTTKQTITEMQETGLWAQLGAAPQPPVEAVPPCHQELLGILSALLLATQAQAGQSGLRVELVEYLRPVGSDSTARIAGVLVASRHRSLAMSLAPGNLLRWPAWFTGTFTARTGAGAESVPTAIVGAARRTQHIRGTPLLRDWLARPLVLHVPTVGLAPAVAPPVQTQSAVPAAVRVAGKWNWSGDWGFAPLCIAAVYTLCTCLQQWLDSVPGIACLLLRTKQLKLVMKKATNKLLNFGF